MEPTLPELSPSTDYGLRSGILSPMETLAQSVSTIAPTTTPAATIPLVCALAGNGTWLAYVLATVAVLLVALCIGRYARISASPGSLYTYASMTLPPWLGATVAWSLLLAYVATGSSVIGGFYHYANLLLRDATGHIYSAVLLATLVTGLSIWIAYRDVKISARLMLWIEAASVTVIVIVVALLLVRRGWHLDAEQLHLRGMTGSGLRLGLVLALFSFVGFESATTLGSEAGNPLHTIPRAVIQSAVLAGAFFTICAYAEVLGFHIAGQDLGASQAPMYLLARVGGVPVLGLLIDIGALVSLFAGTLACITAAARVLLLMAHDACSKSNSRPGDSHHGYGCAASRCSAGSPRRQRSGCLRVARISGHLRFYRSLRIGMHRVAALPAHPPCSSSWSADRSMARRRRYAARARGEFLSGAGRALWQVALRLSCIFGGGPIVVLDSRPRQSCVSRKLKASLP